MSALADRALDVARRADADATLRELTDDERPAYLAGLAERGWRRLVLFGAGILIGACLGLLAGCGGGGTDAAGHADDEAPPTMTIDPPLCAGSAPRPEACR